MHSEREDGIMEDYLDDELTVDDEAPKLKPKQFGKDDPRIDIPTEKSVPAHDHLIVAKEPVETHKPEYGKAYEMDRKKAIRGDKESIGLAPKLPPPTQERKEPKPVILPIHRSDFIYGECSSFGSKNRCEGMTCNSDDDCHS